MNTQVKAASYPVGRGVGAVWQSHKPGSEHRWYTRRPDGKVVPTKDPQNTVPQSDTRIPHKKGEAPNATGLTERDTPEEEALNRLTRDLTPEKIESMSLLEKIIRYIEIARIRGMTLTDVRQVAVNMTYLTVGEIGELLDIFDVDDSVKSMARQIELR